MDKTVLFIMLAVAFGTYITRLVPFVLGERVLDSAPVRYLGSYLPVMILPLMVIFCMRGATTHTEHAAQIVALMVVISVHLLSRMALVSILLGTVTYMVLVN